MNLANFCFWQDQKNNGYLNFYQPASLRMNCGHTRLFMVGRNICKIQVITG